MAFALGSVTGNGGMTVSKVGKKAKIAEPRCIFFDWGKGWGRGAISEKLWPSAPYGCHAPACRSR